MKTHAERIAHTCLEAYDALPQGGGKPQVRSNGRYVRAYLPIAVATGVKCTPYEKLSPFGDVLHDCHAEVLTRRAARVWLLDRLVKEVAADSDTIDGIPKIFIRRDLPKGPRWTLAPHASLHWYVSAPPCGEASSYSLQAKFHDETAPNCDAIEEYEGSSLLRGRDATCAASSGIVVRTKPGRRDAPASISMSCSDKMCVWNTTGIQGALLSRWLDPIYVSSVVVCAPGDAVQAAESCKWALFGRISRHDSMASFGKGSAYRVSTPDVHIVQIAFPAGKEETDARVAQSTGLQPGSSAYENVEPVPCAASILWRRGHRAENLLGGIRQGASNRRPRGEALVHSSWSSVCRRAWYARVQQAARELHSTMNTQIPYYVSKHPELQQDSISVGISDYQHYKRQVVGELDLAGAEGRVQQFLRTRQGSAAGSTHPGKKRFMYKAKSTAEARPGGASPPFSAWLRTPVALSTFTLP